jgi:hypothetical protein
MLLLPCDQAGATISYGGCTLVEIGKTDPVQMTGREGYGIQK